ncbi:Oxaloacetate decarboxylase alpha chain [Salmonella sp. NCTC 11881]|nr:Oxaloacetate decarboxylase alpha chain [Salmonella sp. NCTC 11881]
MTIAITDVVLRDAHQSLFATRLRLDDMLPIAAALDDVGYGSLECWGGATFDACIRFLGEDPWLRLRELKKAMPKTPLQMLLRGQNLLGYRHYADDVVEALRRTRGEKRHGCVPRLRCHERPAQYEKPHYRRCAATARTPRGP